MAPLHLLDLGLGRDGPAGAVQRDVLRKARPEGVDHCTTRGPRLPGDQLAFRPRLLQCSNSLPVDRANRSKDLAC